jgi:hypothetical protein
MNADEDLNTIIKDACVMREVWCDRTAYAAICTMTQGLSGLNGLTDGWAHFLDALKHLRVLSRTDESGITADEAARIRRYIGIVSRVVHR